VNQTWKLRAKDCAPDDVGYIDCFDITILYPDPKPDLIVQSLTATDYTPNVDEYIEVTMVIKNQGVGPATGDFCNGLFYDLSAPPDIETWEDLTWPWSDLDTNETAAFIFSYITSYDPGTWQMYAMADCDGEINESNDNNNYKGPITITWTRPPPDLVVQSLTVEDPSLVITEHTNGTITIRNQGDGPVVDCFYTDVFTNQSSPPSPPATGEYYFYDCWLDPGETICHNFYKIPHSTHSGTWDMWGLVDSWPGGGGSVQESNEGNNVYGPVIITWLDPLSPEEVSREAIIDHALEFLNVNWTCSELNASSVLSCPDWSCAFSPGENVTGEAYSWGGWDKPITDFLSYLSVGLRAGSIDTNTCNLADPYWATGVDCAGLVSRCWETNARKTCTSFVFISDQI
jgi:hypothetical protein